MIDLDGGFVFLRCGGVVRIDGYFGADGDECEPGDAVSIAAGPWTDAHRWFALEVGEAVVYH